MVHRERLEGPTFFETTDVVVNDEWLYACSGVRALTIWDVSGERAKGVTSNVAPTGVSHSSFPRCQHVGLDSAASRIAITNRGDEIQPQPWLWVYDISTPDRPTEAAGWLPQDVSVEGVVLRDDRAYVAGHGSGVIALELANGQLEEIGRFSDASSDAWLPVLVGQTLVVAEGSTGLRTYDVSGPNPVLLATLPIDGSSRDVVVEDGVAYVAASASVVAVDVRDPAQPVILGSAPTSGTALAVAMLGPREVVVAEWDELRGYDFTTPSQPTRTFAEVVPTDEVFSRVLAVDALPANDTIVAGEWHGVHRFDRVRGGQSPDIAISPQSVQFGQVDLDESGDAVVVVRNEGTSPLTVHDVVSAAGISVDQDCFQLAPGEATAIEVRAKLSNSDALTTALQFCSDDPDEAERSVSLTANIPGLDVGDPAPSFALPVLGGSTFSSESLAGKVVVLAYFATF